MPYTTEEMLDDFRKDVARLTAARDALAEELARIEAAIDAAGGTKLEANDVFIARLTAENAALRAAVKPVEAAAAHKVRFWEDDWNPLYHIEVTLTVAECRAIRAALAHKEPSDATT